MMTHSYQGNTCTPYGGYTAARGPIGAMAYNASRMLARLNTTMM